MASEKEESDRFIGYLEKLSSLVEKNKILGPIDVDIITSVYKTYPEYICLGTEYKTPLSLKGFLRQNISSITREKFLQIGDDFLERENSYQKVKAMIESREIFGDKLLSIPNVKIRNVVEEGKIKGINLYDLINIYENNKQIAHEADKERKILENIASRNIKITHEDFSLENNNSFYKDFSLNFQL